MRKVITTIGAATFLIGCVIDEQDDEVLQQDNGERHARPR